MSKNTPLRVCHSKSVLLHHKCHHSTFKTGAIRTSLLFHIFSRKHCLCLSTLNICSECVCASLRLELILIIFCVATAVKSRDDSPAGLLLLFVCLFVFLLILESCPVSFLTSELRAGVTCTVNSCGFVLQSREHGPGEE